LGKETGKPTGPLDHRGPPPKNTVLREHFSRDQDEINSESFDGNQETFAQTGHDNQRRCPWTRRRQDPGLVAPGSCRPKAYHRMLDEVGIYIYILFIGIHTLFDCVTRGYGDHSFLTRPKEDVKRWKRSPVGEEMDVCCLEVKEVEEGGVVHGGSGPRRGDSRGIGGEAVYEGSREDAGARRGKRSGEDAGREGLGGGSERGLAQCARRCGSRGGGVPVPSHAAGCRGVVGCRCEFRVMCLMIRTRAGWQISSSNRASDCTMIGRCTC